MRTDLAPQPSRAVVAVTGATGFIGQHVCASLRQAGHEIVPIDIRPHSDPDGVQDDLSDPVRLGDILRATSVSRLVHAAWNGHPRSAGTNYAGQLTTSVTPTTNTMLAAALAGLEHVVSISSGGGLAGVAAERQKPPAYGWAKRVAEAVAVAHSEMFGFTLTILRPSAVYGPGQNPRTGLGAITVFADALLHHRPVRLLGNGSETRDFLHVRDLAHAVALSASHQADGIFPLGGPESLSLIEVIALIEQVTQTRATIEYFPATGVDPNQVTLDDSAFQKATGWTPQIRLRDSLPELVDSLRRLTP
ncbi:MAG TPA: hypothetical protein DCQ04_03265 [Actinobacteria bacterium]|jgi:UDP-glucose 4-epimerase|nr:NAD-dependent epimerase/dehydratase family protein [Actinomycetales bacterium]HAM21289.1 hypothetical protein [Actinomycetota bacterium]HMT32112.1 NAD-dependent epimerase/dehydratase family protein [Dermatophilaceae bacterium]